MLGTINLMLISLISVTSFADIGISFYKNPQSLFASGQANLKTLKKTMQSTEHHYDFLVELNKKSQWVPATSIAQYIHLSNQVSFQNENYLLTEIKGSWALVEKKQGQKKEWLSVQELSENPKDLGCAMTLIATSLRASPTWKSDRILSVPEKTRLFIEKTEGSWLLVRFYSGTSSTLGYVDINNVLLKVDFAQEVQTADQKWHPFLYREGTTLFLANNTNADLKKIIALRSRKDLGVMLETLRDKNLLLRQNVVIKKSEAQVWAVSQLKEHGKVYWKYQLPKSEGAPTLSKNDILKREIFSVAWSPSNPKIGLASSYGVFFTFDGGNEWTQLSQFKSENHPVQIHEDGSWYVGSFKSKDQGKTFNPYIRMDHLTRLIQSQTKYAPRILKLSEITFTKNFLQIKIDTGTKTFLLATKSNADSISDWDILN